MKKSVSKNYLSSISRYAAVLAIGLTSFFCVSDSHAQNIDPCPVARDLAKTSPPDMATVQADIDVLNLCVQRANLLDQLARFSEEDEKNSADIFGNNVGTSSGGSRTLFDLPERARQPELSAEAVAEEERRRAAEAAAAKKKKEAAAKPDWSIETISGHSAVGFRARLVSGSGQQITVQTNQKLDDKTTVKDISAQGVRVMFNNKEHMLDWR